MACAHTQQLETWLSHSTLHTVSILHMFKRGELPYSWSHNSRCSFSLSLNDFLLLSTSECLHFCRKSSIQQFPALNSLRSCLYWWWMLFSVLFCLYLLAQNKENRHIRYDDDDCMWFGAKFWASKLDSIVKSANFHCSLFSVLILSRTNFKPTTSLIIMAIVMMRQWDIFESRVCQSISHFECSITSTGRSEHLRALKLERIDIIDSNLCRYQSRAQSRGKFSNHPSALNVFAALNMRKLRKCSSIFCKTVECSTRNSVEMRRKSALTEWRIMKNFRRVHRNPQFRSCRKFVWKMQKIVRIETSKLASWTFLTWASAHLLQRKLPMMNKWDRISRWNMKL